MRTPTPVALSPNKDSRGESSRDSLRDSHKEGSRDLKEVTIAPLPSTSTSTGPESDEALISTREQIVESARGRLGHGRSDVFESLQRISGGALTAFWEDFNVTEAFAKATAKNLKGPSLILVYLASLLSFLRFCLRSLNSFA